jgi:hypothetical protein
MKQHITREQLAEISLQEANVLSELLGYSEENKLVYEQIPYILTIGKMIEILDNDKVRELSIDRFVEYGVKNNKYSVYIFTKLEEDKYTEKEANDVELCDALWESIKHLLSRS